VPLYAKAKKKRKESKFRLYFKLALDKETIKTPTKREITEFSWSIQHEITYKSKDPTQLPNVCLKVDCYHAVTLGRDKLLGTLSIDLQTLLTGCVLHKLPLTDQAGSTSGTVEMEIEMAELRKISVLMSNIKVTSNAALNTTDLDPEDIHLKYSHSLLRGVSRSDITEIESNTEFIFHSQPITLKTTVCDNILAEMKITVERDKKNNNDTVQLLGGLATLPFKKYFCLKGEMVRFEEYLQRQGIIVGKIMGYISFMNLPKHVQLIGGVHTSDGMTNGVPLIYAVERPYGCVPNGLWASLLPNNPPPQAQAGIKNPHKYVKNKKNLRKPNQLPLQPPQPNSQLLHSNSQPLQQPQQTFQPQYQQPGLQSNIQPTSQPLLHTNSQPLQQPQQTLQPQYQQPQYQQPLLQSSTQPTSQQPPPPSYSQQPQYPQPQYPQPLLQSNTQPTPQQQPVLPSRERDLEPTLSSGTFQGTPGVLPPQPSFDGASQTQTEYIPSAQYTKNLPPVPETLFSNLLLRKSAFHETKRNRLKETHLKDHGEEGHTDVADDDNANMEEKDQELTTTNDTNI